MFGLGGVKHNDDFASALENGPWLWQDLQFYGGDYVYQFCDNVEGVVKNSTAALPGPGGVGVEKALAGYANWFNTTYLPGACAGYGYADFQGTYNVECFNTIMRRARSIPISLSAIPWIASGSGSFVVSELFA